MANSWSSISLTYAAPGEAITPRSGPRQLTPGPAPARRPAFNAWTIESRSSPLNRTVTVVFGEILYSNDPTRPLAVVPGATPALTCRTTSTALLAGQALGHHRLGHPRLLLAVPQLADLVGGRGCQRPLLHPLLDRLGQGQQRQAPGSPRCGRWPTPWRADAPTSRSPRSAADTLSPARPASGPRGPQFSIELDGQQLPGLDGSVHHHRADRG